jgi:hypothetical protein
MNNLTIQEIEVLVVAAVTAYENFKRIPAQLLKEYAAMGYFINFSPLGQTYYFSDIEQPKGISMSLKGLKYKKEMVEKLYDQITYIINEWETNYYENEN